MRELFVYYRVRAAQAGAALQAVRAFQARLVAAHPQLNARLLRRPEEADGRQTWMETYAGGPLGIGTELQVEIERQALALAPHIEGARHTEVFMPCV